MSIESLAVILAIALVGLCIPAMAADPPASQPAELLVFILAGQSNMGGAGVVAELPDELKAPQKDVLFVNFWATQFQPLDPAKLGKNFGPEVTFGLEMSRAMRRPVGLIKLAVGGTSIEQHWNPLVYDKDKHVGDLYKRLTDYVAAVRAKNANMRIAGMIWMQGEADARYHSKTVEQYRDKLQALIDGCRKEFAAPDMPFVAGRVHFPPAQFHDQVRRAQESVDRPNYAWINCDDLLMHDDKLHYNTAGQLELGRNFAAAMLKLMNRPTTRPE